MCLSVPCQIISIDESTLTKMAKVSLSGVTKEISLALIDSPEVGDYVLVHAGFAISRLDEEKAREVFSLLENLQK